MRSLSMSLALSLALGCLPAWPAARAADAFSAATIVPADVDLFIAVDDASSWRRGPGGMLLDRGGRELAAAGDLAGAWTGLAGALGLPGERAFDDLLGRRVVFAQRNAPPGGGEPSWVLISLVSKETEALLRQRLKPAPRRVEKGTAVLSLEDGRFWLASIADKQIATLMLAPAASPALFEDLIGNLGRGPDRSLAASKLGEDLRAVLRGGEALMLRRTRDAGGGAAVIAAGARREGEGLTLHMLVRSEKVAERVRKTPHSSRRVFDEAGEGAFAAVVEWNVADLANALGIALPALPLPPMLTNFEGRDRLGSRRIYMLRPSTEDGMEVTLALESTDVRTLAPAGDRLIAEMLRGWWAGPGDAGADVGTLNLGGMFPEAVRDVDLSDAGTEHFPSEWMRGLRLAWCFPSRANEDAPMRDGWWVVGLGTASVHRLTGILLADDDPAAPREPWISLGVVHPHAIIMALEGRGVPQPLLMSSAGEAGRGIERVTWTLSRGDHDSIRGEARLTFVVPPRAP